MLVVTCGVGCALFCARPEAEETFGKKTPWDSVAKLEGLVKKSLRDTDTIDWILKCVNDLVLNKVVAGPNLSISHLTGKNQGGKGTGCPILTAAPRLSGATGHCPICLAPFPNLVNS